MQGEKPYHSWLYNKNPALHYPQSQLAVYQKGTHYSVIKVFNRLPAPMKQLSQVKQLKTALKDD
jgi:hypothetical protein